MRYNLRLADVPRTCACGDEYSINHCPICKRGGYVIIRHNVVKDMQVKPQLLPVTGEVLPAGAYVRMSQMMQDLK